MVVLLVGIMTILQMFPTGFRVVKAAESQTIATKLAQGEIERWKNLSANLPTGILPIDASGAVLNGQFPGPPFDGFVPDGSGGYVRGNVLNIRQIIGETTTIPVGSYFSTGYGSAYGGRYTLAFGPIEAERVGGELVGLAIKSGDMGRDDSEDAGPRQLKRGNYAIGYGQQEVPEFYMAFPIASIPTSYYVSYSYWAVSSSNELKLTSVLDEDVNVPADYGDWKTVPVDLAAIPSGHTFLALEPGSDACARAFVEKSGNWSDNPYEFALVDNILGVISFNPTGHGMYEHTAQGYKPIQARIDYRIYDPRILREDKVVPQLSSGAAGIPIKLALRFILDIDDPTDNPNEPTYQGIAPGLGLGDSIMIIDLGTGMRVDTTNVTVKYTAGVVNLPERADLYEFGNSTPVMNVKLASRRVRFLYRADGDWSIQCQKAYSVYSREWTAPVIDYRHYKVGGGFGAPHELYFAACEAGKTISVDYSYGFDEDGIEHHHKVVGESYQISDYKNAAGYYFVTLNLSPDAELTRVHAVVGTSFKVRAVWRDGKRWRHVDMETSLIRGTT